MQQDLFDLAKLVNNLYTFKEYKKSPFIINKHALASPKHDSCLIEIKSHNHVCFILSKRFLLKK